MPVFLDRSHRTELDVPSWRAIPVASRLNLPYACAASPALLCTSWIHLQIKTQKRARIHPKQAQLHSQWRRFFQTHTRRIKQIQDKKYDTWLEYPVIWHVEGISGYNRIYPSANYDLGTWHNNSMRLIQNLVKRFSIFFEVSWHSESMYDVRVSRTLLSRQLKIIHRLTSSEFDWYVWYRDSKDASMIFKANSTSLGEVWNEQIYWVYKEECLQLCSINNTMHG